MRTITVNLYTFAELPTEAAKDKARQWLTKLEADDFCFDAWDDIETIATILGIGFAVPIEDAIRWSGFGNQGDGASFKGTYRHAERSTLRIRDHAPQDDTLHAIADRLCRLQKQYRFAVTADVEFDNSRYTHERTMRFAVEVDGKLAEEQIALALEVEESMRAFARWIYAQIEAEYEYRLSRENIDAVLIGNAYEFREDGSHQA